MTNKVLDHWQQPLTFSVVSLESYQGAWVDQPLAKKREPTMPSF